MLIQKVIAFSLENFVFYFTSIKEGVLSSFQQTLFLSPQLPCRGVAVITTTQLHSAKFELRLSASSIPARGVSEVCNEESDA